MERREYISMIVYLEDIIKDSNTTKLKLITNKLKINERKVFFSF